MAVRVLAIDDDPAITELLALLLGAYGYIVITANSSEYGLNVIRETHPDIVIMDLMMPGMDGCQICSQVRTFSNIPILILSALDDPGMAAKSLDAGADDYLTKPFTTSVLVAHLNNLVRRSKSNNGPNRSTNLQTSEIHS